MQDSANILFVMVFFLPNMQNIYAGFFRERHIGDYDFISIISREDAEKDYEISIELVGSIKNYLVEYGFYKN